MAKGDILGAAPLFIQRDKEAREMFKRAGICLLDVQVVEKYLALLLWPSRVAHLKPLSHEEFAKLDEDLWSMNMGRLQRLFHGRFKDESFVDQLTRVKEGRDYFIHLFFVEAALQEPISRASVDDINQLILRLDELHTLFTSFARRLEPLVPKEQRKVSKNLPNLYRKVVKAKTNFGTKGGREAKGSNL